MTLACVMVGLVQAYNLIDYSLKHFDRPVTGYIGDLFIDDFLQFDLLETYITNAINIICYAAIGAKVLLSVGGLSGWAQMIH